MCFFVSVSFVLKCNGRMTNGVVELDVVGLVVEDQQLKFQAS